MTVTTTANSTSYAGNGTTTAFAFPYIFFEPADLVVTLYDATNSLIAPPPVLGGGGPYGYMVSGTVTNGEYASGGTVTFNSAPSSGFIVSLLRDVPAIQEVDLVDNAKFPAQTVNVEFDKLTAMIQDVEGDIDVLQGQIIGSGGLAPITSQQIAVPSLADLKALVVPYPRAVRNQYRATTADQSGGVWVFRTGDFSSRVALDPTSGLWAAPNTTPDGTAGVWQRQFSGPASLLWWGARGNAVTDDFAALQAAVTTAGLVGVQLTGDGRTYALAGNLMLPDNTYLMDARFLQLAPEHAGRRTLTCHDDVIANGLTLIRVSVNRNGTPDSISTQSDAAGIWLSGNAIQTARLYCEDVEVTGSGRGSAMLFGDFATVTLVRPYVHDMFWHTVADPGSGGEQILGIGTTRVPRVIIDQPQIHRLMGWWGSTRLRGYQTDGIAISGASSATVSGGMISHCGEGFDGSGSAVSRNVWFYYTIFEDCGAGWKSMSHSDSGAVGCVFVRPQLWGIVSASSNLSGITVARNQQFASCFVVDCGASHDYDAFTTAAYRVDWGGGVPIAGQLVENIRFDNCSAIAHSATATGSIAGTLLTVTNTAAGLVSAGQNIAGTGVTAGSYIVGHGRRASIIGSILGNNNLHVTSTHYGAIAVGQVIFGPGIRKGLTIQSGAGADWILDNDPTSAPHPDVPNVALLLELDDPNVQVWTVTPSQTVAATTLTLTGNMDVGFQIEPELVDKVTANSCTVVGQTGTDFHNFTKRVSTWASDGKFRVIGGYTP